MDETFKKCLEQNMVILYTPFFGFEIYLENWTGFFLFANTNMLNTTVYK